jgi:hypothetical protein
MSHYLLGDRYILYTTCYDKKYDILNPKYILEGETIAEVHQRLSLLTYDPTNGTKSIGDMWTLSNNLRKPNGFTTFPKKEEKEGQQTD